MKIIDCNRSPRGDQVESDQRPDVEASAPGAQATQEENMIMTGVEQGQREEGEGDRSPARAPLSPLRRVAKQGNKQTRLIIGAGDGDGEARTPGARGPASEAGER
ncbi:unnamed protein product [Amoebophrya sp. A120]|nr:unnamed protein product [Amoebophrya sp. A120]|eukprot:GSA120T00003190001.1